MKVLFLNIPKNTMQNILIITLCLTTLTMAMPSEMTDAQLDELLANRNMMQRHLKCTLGQGPCDPVGRRLRILAPLVVRGACPQCSPKEAEQIRKTLAYVQRNYPWEWAKIVRQFT